MKIQIEKKGESVIFIPEKIIDYFHCGLIHHEIASTVTLTTNTDAPEQKLESLKISKDALVVALTWRKK